MTIWVTGVLSSPPRHILHRTNPEPFDGKSKPWAQQLADAAGELSPEEVADKLGAGVFLNVAAQARAIQVLNQHKDAVKAMIEKDLASHEKDQVERAAGEELKDTDFNVRNNAEAPLGTGSREQQHGRIR